MNNLIAGPTWMVGGIVLVLLVAILLGFTFFGNKTSSKVLTDNLMAPLNDATSATIDIYTGSGNLTIDSLAAGEQALASGTLQYVEDQGIPTRTLETNDGQASFSVRSVGKGKSSFRFPWEACNALTDWNIHLNPTVLLDITARSGGGNGKLDFSGMAITRVLVDTGGGNLDLVLPENSANLNVTAKSGGGNVTVEIGSGTTGSNTLIAGSGAGNVVVKVPGGIAVKVHVSTGMGKVIVDPRFSKVDDKTYQTPDFDSAADKVEITAQSGAGNVSVNTK